MPCIRSFIRPIRGASSSSSSAGSSANSFSIGVETLALFIRFWLNTTPPLPEPAAKAARAQAGARYDNFIATLGRRLNEGPKLRQEIPDDVAEHSASGSSES